MYIPKFRSPLICTMKWAERIFTFWLRNTQRSALSKDACPPISLRNFVPLKVGMYRYAREERHEQHRSESAGGSPAHLASPDASRDAGVTSLPGTSCSPLVAGCCRNIEGKWLGLEGEHRFALLHIDRHRNVRVHDQPRAVDPPPANGRTQPEIGLLPSGQGSAQPVEAVGECHVIAHRDGQVVHFIADRTLERRERLFPAFPVCICAHVAQRGHEVERHEFGCVHGHHPIDVPRAKRLDPTLYDPCDFGFLVVLLFFYCHCFLLPLAFYEPRDSTEAISCPSTARRF